MAMATMAMRAMRAMKTTGTTTAFRTVLPLRQRTERRGLAQVAIVGSGPAGFYTAHRLQQLFSRRNSNQQVKPDSCGSQHRPDDEGVQITIVDRNTNPFGLVRHGVAPDHPEVKTCVETFESVVKMGRVEFVGNVVVGRDEDGKMKVGVDAMLEHFDAVVLATGAGNSKKASIEGEDLVGVLGADQVVGWYTGSPSLSFTDVKDPDSNSRRKMEDHDRISGLVKEATNIVVLGAGNVGLDISRMMILSRSEIEAAIDPPTLDSDGPTVRAMPGLDVRAAMALESKDRPSDVSVRLVARRGPAQAAFTTKEVRELVKLSKGSERTIRLSPVGSVPDINQLDKIESRKVDRKVKRLLSVLHGIEQIDSVESIRSDGFTGRTVNLDFFLRPVKFVSDVDNPNRLSGVQFRRTILTDAQTRFDPSGSVVDTSDSESIITIPADLAIVSVGFSASIIESSGLICCSSNGKFLDDGSGRLLSDNSNGSTGSRADKVVIPGLYAVGWARTGPTGVIAHTMADAFSVADTIYSDLVQPQSSSANTDPKVKPKMGWSGVAGRTRKMNDGADSTSWDDWKKIEAGEIARRISRQQSK